jgi:transposase
MWRRVSPHPGRPSPQRTPQRTPLESPPAGAPRTAARRSGDRPLTRRDVARQRAASRAISPAGKVDFHSQDRAFNADDVVACLEHLLRKVSGRMVLLWDGAPIHRSHTIQEFLTNGAAQRMHLERLPAYAPELNPDEGLWPQLKGVEWRQVCCFTIPHLRGERCDAVKRVRHKPRILHGFFRGAKL